MFSMFLPVLLVLTSDTESLTIHDFFLDLKDTQQYKYIRTLK